MGNHRIVVIGAGGEMASFGIQRLAANRQDCAFSIYDLDPMKVDLLAASLTGSRVEVGSFDLFDASALRAAVEGASLVVLGAGPYLRTAPPVMRACIEAGVDYLDFADDVESTLDGLALDSDARANGVALLLGCGASPGFSNLIAVDAASRLDEVEAIDVCWVTGDEGAHAYGPAVIEHIFHMWSGQTVVWRDGRRAAVETFVESDVFPMGGTIGDYRLHLTAHPEAVTLPRRFPRVRSVRVMGGAHPAPMNGLLRGIALAVEQGRMTLSEAVEWVQVVGADGNGSLKGWRNALSGMWGQVRRGESSLGDLGGFLWMGMRKRHLPYRSGLLVRASGVREGEPETITIRTPTGGPDTFLGSMASATGNSLAAFMSLALDSDGDLEGVLAPEDWVEPSSFYAALEKLGTPRHEIVEDPTFS